MTVDKKKDDRLSLRVNGKLKREVQKYCASRELDISELTTRFFERIVVNEKERKKATPDK